MTGATVSLLPAARLPGWPRRLADVVARHADRPFAWGEHDCCTFAADVVEAITGRDPMAAWRGAYVGQLAAARLLREHGGLLGLVSGVLGEPVAPTLALRGDVVLYLQPDHADRPALGVCLGPVFTAPGPAGLAQAPMRLAVHAWRI